PQDRDVHGPRLGRRLRRPEVREVDLAHLVEAEPGVAGAGRHRDPREQHEGDAGRDQATDVIPPAGEPPSLHRRCMIWIPLTGTTAARKSGTKSVESTANRRTSGKV